MNHLPALQPYIDFNNPHLQLVKDVFYFLDTSFLIALTEPADKYHVKAANFYERLIDDYVLVTHSIAAVEFVHVYSRTLYTQERKDQIFYECGGNYVKAKKTIDETDFIGEWNKINKYTPEKTHRYSVQALNCITPLLEDEIIELHSDNRDIVLDSFKLKLDYHIGSADAMLIATARSLGAIFVTTDLRVAKVPITGILKYATTP